MFVRSKRSVQGGKTYEYLQICEAFREDGKPRQKVLATLGRLDALRSSGDLDDLVVRLARFSENLRVLNLAKAEGLHAASAKLWGPVQIFSRLWESQGVPEIIHGLVDKRSFCFDVERVAFVLALQRLLEPGSDRHGAEWLKTLHAPEVPEIALHQFYRTCSFLQDVRTSLEYELFRKDRDLFAQDLDLVFIDTTSTFVYRSALKETRLRRRGYSRDRRGDLPQVVLCVAVDRRGWPVAWDILPGNTADKPAFARMVRTLRNRFHVGRTVVVADRGMISKENLKLLADHRQAPFEYVLGCRMRQEKEVAEEVLARGGRYKQVDDNLDVKEVMVQDRRYIVCRNPREAERDKAARTALLEKLEQTLAEQGPKSLMGNKGFARFVSLDKEAVTINRAAVEADARLDGKFVLRTNTDLPAAEVAHTYKSLWRVERCFREQKSTLEMRPMFHQTDRNSIGHLVASFLALRLEVDLQRRLDERGCKVEWQQLMTDLAEVRAVDLEMDGHRYVLRTDLVGTAHHAYAAAGVRPPSPVTRLS